MKSGVLLAAWMTTALLLFTLLCLLHAAVTLPERILLAPFELVEPR